MITESFRLSLFLAIIYGRILVMIFGRLSQICFEFSLKIVYNIIGFYNHGGGIFKLRECKCDEGKKNSHGFSFI